jgi:hypothetical protein
MRKKIMEIDFSSINLQYLIQARDIAREDPERARILLSLSQEFADLLTTLTPDELTQILHIKVPLLLPRQEAWWWSRLLKTLQEGSPDEIEVLMEHISLSAASRSPRSK